ncbi:SDR family oxidoreductase [Paenibacillus sp. sgz500958]|uniref:SDR family oxidoreductase n=1 Tax=Paenibacillus sp. sgz500958 TaxID=3242475 RepID=UPI0036D3300A
MGAILVTGFTGNTGREVAKRLSAKDAEMVCAVRDPKQATLQYGNTYSYVKLDYARSETFVPALQGIDRLFLMYPPETAFEGFHGFIRTAKQQGVRHIVYLSVKDAQYMPFIPHYKNEREIRRSGIPFTFLRAGYFMQNLNLFLLDELITNDRIYVPAGKGKTSFTDIRDIAEIAARSLTEGNKHYGKKYALTGSQALDFYEVAKKMTAALGRPIHYANPSLKEFKACMLAKGLDAKYINVVAGLHLVTKIGLAGGVTNAYNTLTGEQPTVIDAYLEDYKEMFGN